MPLGPAVLRQVSTLAPRRSWSPGCGQRQVPGLRPPDPGSRAPGDVTHTGAQGAKSSCQGLVLSPCPAHTVPRLPWRGEAPESQATGPHVGEGVSAHSGGTPSLLPGAEPGAPTLQWACTLQPAPRLTGTTGPPRTGTAATPAAACLSPQRARPQAASRARPRSRPFHGPPGCEDPAQPGGSPSPGPSVRPGPARARRCVRPSATPADFPRAADQRQGSQRCPPALVTGWAPRALPRPTEPGPGRRQPPHTHPQPPRPAPTWRR